ncbi:hypothetical protein AVEN_1172-1 [Araneus ventricosus]|uniref:Uncharacterized protein n=1 Tax=Araneus ventricosus TaxID=182803 RepID=A0A4Y2ECS1_ARAVE|nr:hypothetical protein AVEN_1172-1 [Araneus ventricosus]
MTDIGRRESVLIPRLPITPKDLSSQFKRQDGERESIYVWRRTAREREEEGKKRVGKRNVFLPKWSEGAAVGTTARGGWRHELEAVWRSIGSHAYRRHATAGTTTVYDAVRCETDADFIFKTTSLLRTYLSNGCLKHTSPEIKKNKKERVSASRLLADFSSSVLFLPSLHRFCKGTFNSPSGTSWTDSIFFFSSSGALFFLPCRSAIAGRPLKCRTADWRTAAVKPRWMPSMCTLFSRSCGRASSDQDCPGRSATGAPTERRAAMKNTTTQVSDPPLLCLSRL